MAASPPIDTATQVSKIARYATQEGLHVCHSSKTELETQTCWKMFEIYQKSFNDIQLSLLKMSPSPGGISGGLEKVTEKLVTPLAIIAIEGATEGVLKSMSKNVIKTAIATIE